MTNGESDFESRGFTHDYEADYISVQCVALEACYWLIPAVLTFLP